jgi:hypothetical protein
MKKTIIKLPRLWMMRSLMYAEKAVPSYDNPKKDKSWARPGVISINRQMLGKAGECVFCLFQNLDPDEMLNWITPWPDVGWDLIIRERKVDVKTSDTEYLIWNVLKNKELPKCPADLFVLVRRLRHPTEKQKEDQKVLLTLDEFEVSGWISVKEFIAKHHSAPAGHWMDEHTKHMHMDELRLFTDATRAGYPNGFVGIDSDGLFRHFCHCGTEAGTGFGMSLRQGKFGKWFCPEHVHEGR